MSPNTESEELARRIVGCMPAGSYEMGALVRLFSIEATTSVPTAAVTCRVRPRLLINPDFVRDYCRTDEHLFLLVLHELYHVLLGHTRLYPRPTLLHNIAFDAIINASICRRLHAPEHRGFFEVANPALTLPSVLLRPPEGWPEDPHYEGPTREIRGFVRRLYPPQKPGGGFPAISMPTYGELLALLRAEAGALGGFILLGNHQEGGEDGEEVDTGLLSEIIREVAGHWPMPNQPGSAGGDGGQLRTRVGVPVTPPPHPRKVFARILRRVLQRSEAAQPRRGTSPLEAITGMGVIPNGGDRTAAARRLLGLPSTLWQQNGLLPTPAHEALGTTHVYFDVSGSMSSLIPHLLGVLRPHVRRGEARVFQFSTSVVPMPLSDLAAGRVSSTGGTDINAVLRHALATTGLRRMLILTDGITGTPEPRLQAEAQIQRIRVHVVLPAESGFREHLEGLAASIKVLPPLRS